MKKLAILLVALLLMLSGCKNQEPQDTLDPTAVTGETALPSGFYVPDSALEQQSNGAILQYALDKNAYPYIGAMGENLLLVTSGENPELLVLKGEEGIPVIRLSLPEGMDVEAGAYQATDTGFVYYDSQSCCAVYLDMQLQEQKRIQIPSEIDNLPVFAADGSRIFYAIGKEIQSIDSEQEIPRMIRSFECDDVQLLGCGFDGEVLICSIAIADGKTQTLYISGQTGENLSAEQGLVSLTTYKKRYIAQRVDGGVEQRLFGELDTDAKLLTITDGTYASALELGGAVCWQTDDAGDLSLAYYDLAAEKKTAQITVAGAGEMMAIRAFAWSESVWFLAESAEASSPVLYQWKFKDSQVSEDVTCVAPAFSIDAPDEAGLQACAEQAKTIGDKYGVSILVWKDAVAYSDKHTLIPEHRPETITQCLNELETLLAVFPEKFLSQSVSKELKICVVRSVDGEEQSVHFRSEGSGYLILTSGSDIEDAFLQTFGYIVDSHVLGNSAEYDYWYKGNPSGFTYGEASKYSEDYLTGDSRAFVDAASMESVVTDRSHIFWQAMKEDNGEMFASDAMQNKLRRLCVAIRDAWGLKKQTDVYPWEQYLEKPIAYKK